MVLSKAWNGSPGKSKEISWASGSP